MLEGATRPAANSLPRAVALRWLSLAVLLVGELLAITTWLDTGTLEHRPGFLAGALGHSPVLLNIALAFFGVLLLVIGPRLPARIAGVGQRSEGHRWVLALALHLAALAGFLVVSARIFDEGSRNAPLGIESAAAWLVLALASFVLWLLAIAPWHAWRWVIVAERRGFLASAAVAVAAWLAGQASQVLWRPLADATFRVSRELLGLLYPDVVADAGHRILGTSSFRVEIAPSCSGYEGIGLIVAFVGVYLWLFRSGLRFPQALLLLPISAGIIWLFNAVRIAALIAVGSSWSPQIAAGGFHSQAGWISFIVVALLVVGLTHRSGLFAHRQDPAQASASEHVVLAAALVMPFVVLMAASILTTAVSAGFDAWYPLKVSAAAGALWYFRATYRQLGWEWSWASVAIGVAVFVFWILLEPTPDTPPTLPDDLAAMPLWLAGLWLVFRVLGSVVVIPLVEELAFRGYLLRKLAASHFEDLDPRQFSLFAFVASSVLFGVLHGRWLAGTLAGMAYALAVYRRGQIGDAVAAHATTNGLIALNVLLLGEWGLWT